MKAIKTLAWIGLAVMSAAIIYGFLYGDLLSEGEIIRDLAWGRVTMVDTLVVYTLLAAWIFYRERIFGWKLAWTLLVFVFGSYAICLYILITAYRCYNSPGIFFMGKGRRT